MSQRVSLQPADRDGESGSTPGKAPARTPLYRSASFLIANQAVVSGLGFVFWIFAARNFRHEVVGQATSLVASAVFLAVLANLGLPYALVRHLPTSPSPRALVRTALKASALVAALVGGAAAVVLPAVDPAFAFLGADPGLAALFVTLIVLWTVELSVEQALVVARRAERTTVMLSAFAAIRLPFPILFAFGGPRELLAGWAVGMAAALLLGLGWFLPRALSTIEPPARAAPLAFRQLVFYGAANHIGNLLGLAATMLSPLVVLQVLGGSAGARGAATFYLSMSLAQLLYVVPAAVALAQFAEGARPESDFRRDRRRAFIMALSLVIPGTLGMVVLAGPLLSVFGPAYAASGSRLLGWLALASLALVPETILATGHRLAGNLRPVIAASLLATAVTLLGAVAYLPSVGLEAVGMFFFAGHTGAALLLTAMPPKDRAGRDSGAPSLLQAPATSPAPVSSPLAAGRPGTPSAAGVGAAPGKAVVMVLNWNAGVHLANCLASLEQTVPQGTRIVVLDNASTDGSLDRAVAGHPRMEVRRFGENLGFAGAYNRGIREADEEFIVLLNPDTIVDSTGWLERLVEAADRDPELAAIACKLLFADDPSRINSVGGLVYWWTGPVDAGFGELDRGQFGDGFEPFAPCGGAMLVRRSAFLEVGGFDEKMFAYIEDVDLSWRMRLRGMKIGFAPDVAVRHKFSVTLGGMSSMKVYLTNRNFLRAMLRNYSASTLVVALPCYALWTAAKIAGGFAVERSPRLVAAVVRSVVWNAELLGDSLRERREIQATRVVNDREIRRRMSSRAFEPLSSVRRRLEIMRHGVLGVSKWD